MLDPFNLAMRFRIHRPFLALLLVCAAPLGAQAVDSAATLSPGDVIRIVVWRRPEFSGDFVVAPDSTITHPLYKDVKVAGAPFRTVEERVRVFLSRYETTPAFVVSPLLRIFVGGEVRQPSVYTIAPGTTVAQAVALAGGPTERGRLDEVGLVRNQRRSTLDLTRSDSYAVAEVRSGDQVLVGRRTSFFTDVLAPTSSVVAAVAAVVSIIIQTQHR